MKNHSNFLVGKLVGYSFNDSSHKGKLVEFFVSASEGVYAIILNEDGITLHVINVCNVCMWDKQAV